MFIGLGSVLVILLLERALRLLDFVLGSTGSLTLLLELLAYLVPHYIGVALPAALFLGIAWSFSRMSSEKELDACLAAGIGPVQLIRPVAALSVLLTIFTLVVFGFAQPHARYVFRILEKEIGSSASVGLVQPNVFTRVGQRVFIADEVAESGAQLSYVFVHEIEDDGTTKTTTARAAQVGVTSVAGEAAVTLHDVVQLAAPAEVHGGELGSVTLAEQMQTSLPLPTSDGWKRGRDERELTLTELWSRRDSPPSGIPSREMTAEFNDRLVRSLSVLFLPFLAVPLSLRKPRQTRPYGAFAGFVGLLVYDKLIQIGETMVATGASSIWVSQWLPFALVAGTACVLFYRLVHSPTKDRIVGIPLHRLSTP